MRNSRSFVKISRGQKFEALVHRLNLLRAGKAKLLSEGTQHQCALMARKSAKTYSPPRSRKAAAKIDVAHEHGVSLRTVDTWIAEHKIPYRKYGPRLIRFDLDKVAAALERYTVKEVS